MEHRYNQEEERGAFFRFSHSVESVAGQIPRTEVVLLSRLKQIKYRGRNPVWEKSMSKDFQGVKGQYYIYTQIFIYIYISEFDLC